MNPEGTMHTFHTPDPVSLRVELIAGKIEVTAAETDSTTVELIAISGGEAAQDVIDETKIEQRGDEIVVLVPRTKGGGLFRSRIEIEALITVPIDSSAKLQAGSADIKTNGQLGDVRAESGSGDVVIEHGAAVETKTGSGDISVGTATRSLKSKGGSADVEVGTVNGDAEVLSGSGDIVIGGASGQLKIKSGSGDIAIQDAGDLVDVMAGSGDLRVRRIDHGIVKAKTGSGDVSVSIVEGTSTYLDVSTVTGDVRSDLEGAEPPEDGAPTTEVHIRTGSGDVVLQRA